MLRSRTCSVSSSRSDQITQNHNKVKTMRNDAAMTSSPLQESDATRAMLSLQKIRKVFRTEDIETTALDDVSIDISRGEFVSIMGPSGCGKSTLLNIIGLLDNLDGGQYWFLDEEVSTYGERKLAQLRKHNIGFIFQSFNLIDELSVFDNVELPLLYQKVPVNERRERVDAMLEKVGIYTRRDHMPQQLSGGQQQRVAVARAIVGRPAMILADEPTGNLDSRNAI